MKAWSPHRAILPAPNNFQSTFLAQPVTGAERHSNIRKVTERTRCPVDRGPLKGRLSLGHLLPAQRLADESHSPAAEGGMNEEARDLLH